MTVSPWKPAFIVIGAGGHACVVAGMLQDLDAPVLGMTDRDTSLIGTRPLDIPVLGDDGVLDGFGTERIRLANGIGVSPRIAGAISPDAGTGARRRVFETLRAAGFRFPAIRHASAIIAGATEIGDGAQIMAGAVIQPRTQIGENAVVNSSASIDHDCIVGAHSFIAPGAVLCGTVRIGAGALIGAGAVILPGVTIGENAVIGAGTCIRRDIEAGAFGV
jgi:sugar O-acyltransferase (sialic acid O-acetyltransferase NeuD family)